MKKVLIAALLILSVVTVNAKKSDTKTKVKNTGSSAVMALTGSIADELSGEALVGVEVKIEGTDLKTYTDFDGNFSFAGVKPGEYKLLTKYISYKKKTEALAVNSSENNIKIKLQSSN